MRLIDADELLNEFDKLDLDYGATGGVAECITITEQAPTIEPSGDLISRQDAIDVGNKIVEELSLSSIEWDDLKYWAKELFDALPSAETTGALDDAIAKYVADGYMLPPSVDNIPSADRPKYNLELIRDIVRQLGHLDNYIADTYLRPNNKIHIQFENIFSDDCYFIEDDKYILAELEKIATNTEDCVEFTLTNNKKVIIHSADKPKGEWNYLHGSIGSYMTINCPFCGETFSDVAEWKYNFCPHCGADMRKE